LNRDAGPVLRKKSEEGDDVFMMSYAALMILLLTFMILMVTLSKTEEPRFRKAIGSVRGAFSILPYSGGRNPMMEGSAGFLPQETLARSTAGGGSRQEPTLYERKVAEIKQKAELDDLSGLEVVETDHGLQIRLSDRLMFERGSAELKPDIRPVLDLITEAVRARPGRVSIVGSTCDLPISTSAFPSNWELSIVRAVNILHHLESGGVPPDSLYAYGLADQCPLVPNDSERNRKLNRRVEIYVNHIPGESGKGDNQAAPVDL
jgi:chemotaxis protein MotB